MAWSDTFLPNVEATALAVIQKYSSITFDANSTVTNDEVLEFATKITNQMVAAMAAIGYTRTPAQYQAGLTDPESNMLKETCAVGAAWLAAEATFYANRSPNRSSLAEDLAQHYNRDLKQLLTWIRRTQITLTSTDFILEGDVTARSVSTTPEQDDIFEFDEDL